MEEKQEIIKSDTKEVAFRTEEGFVVTAKNFLKNHGDIIIPPNYDVNSAVKSLYLEALQTKDKQKRLALEVCTQTSIEQVIQKYVQKGLDIAKKQCYLIVYGNTLTLQESYFGKQKQAKTYSNIRINSNVIYEGEKVEIEQRIDGSKIIKHTPDFSKFDIDKIVGAYAVAVKEDGSVDDSDIMTINEIKRSWAQSQTGGDTQKKFPVEMARKTVIGRLSKKYINTSDDSSKFVNLESDMENYYEEEIDANNVVITDNKKEETTTTTNEEELIIEDIGENNIEEIPYSRYMNNKDKYKAIPKSYNSTKKTIKVYC